MILSKTEISLLYTALAIDGEKTKATYTDLANKGILKLVQEIEDFLMPDDEP